ncbi:MAG: tail fiber protein [Verrucomicrobiota bacterium JB022]|nr:tail fiber protein [Verrucomicrobiota bacterium JB022]
MDDENYIGSVEIFAGNYAPSGWMFCDGTALLVSQYQALFSLIGTTYGGNGQPYFNLPDLRANIPIHTGQMPGSAIYHQIGQAVGSQTVAIQSNQMPIHTHAAVVASMALKASTSLALNSASTTSSLHVSDQNATQPAATAGASLGTTVMSGGRTTTVCDTYNTNAPNVALNAASVTSQTSLPLPDVGVTGNLGITNAATGGGPIGHDNMQPFLALNFIICVNGLYPPRP